MVTATQTQTATQPTLKLRAEALSNEDKLALVSALGQADADNSASTRKSGWQARSASSQSSGTTREWRGTSPCAM